MTENNNRRDFLKSVAVGSAAASYLFLNNPAQAKMANPIKNPKSEFDVDGKVTKRADVLVVGGGPAGIIAAIQSARAGSKTVLIECDSQLGGTTTTGGVAFPGLFRLVTCKFPEKSLRTILTDA